MKTFKYVSASKYPFSKKNKTITLDSSYNLYIRELFDETGEEKRFKTNLSKKSYPDTLLIEVEYLFISKKHNNVIYISTPPDVHKKYFSKNWLGENHVNAYDFRTLSFGKIRGKDNDIVFESKTLPQSDTWLISYSSKKDTVFIDGITERDKGLFQLYVPVAEALEERIGFKRVEDAKIVFKIPSSDSKDDLALLEGNKIYFLNQGKKYQIVFFFNKPIKGDAKGILFKNTRIKSKPDALYP